MQGGSAGLTLPRGPANLVPIWWGLPILIVGLFMAIPKLKDIAVATGVHEMTVSRALRNVGRMRPETRQRVLEAARAMGYRPNAAAAAMRTGRTGCIAMICGPRRHSSCLTPQAMSAIIDAVASHGGYLAHAAVPNHADVADAATLPNLLRRHMAEGVLLSDTHDAPAQFDDFFLRNGLPAVWMNHKRDHNAVYPDDFGAVRKVTGQLIALGHRRIAIVRLVRESAGGQPAEHGCTADRVAGYEAAMRQAGLVPDAPVFDRHWDQWHQPAAVRLQQLARVFQDPDRRPTAVITCSDGPVLLGQLQLLNVRVPEEISLVSFSTHAAHTVEQMVSLVPVPFDVMGQKAADMLFEMIESGQKERPAISLPYGEIASMHTVRNLA